MLKISAGSADLGALRAPALALLLEQGATPALGTLDRAVTAAIQRVIVARDFRGTRDETLHLLGTENGVERLLLVGMGKVTDRFAALKRAASIAARRANQAGFGRLAIFAGDVTADDAEVIALGAIAGSWDMKEFQTPAPEDERRAPLTEVVVLSANSPAAQQGIARGRAIGDGHSLARRLANSPGNACTQEYPAETA